jgi:hypothetical protein
MSTSIVSGQDSYLNDSKLSEFTKNSAERDFKE